MVFQTKMKQRGVSGNGVSANASTYYLIYFNFRMMNFQNSFLKKIVDEGRMNTHFEP